MIMEKELAEYRVLSSTLEELREKYLEKKQELRRLVGETAALRKEALRVLARANRLTVYLTGRQRQITGLCYRLGEIEARINQYDPALLQTQAGADGSEITPEMHGPKLREDCLSLRELKQNGLVLIRMIDSVRNKVLQFELIEMRCRELIISINKVLEAFRHEYRIIRRNIYPFGILSIFHRTLRRLLGSAYFSFRDLEDIAALAAITGHVLKIADSPEI